MTVTVTVVVAERVLVRVFFVCVDFVFVVLGGWIVTVLDGDVVVQTAGRLVFPQAPVSGGPVALVDGDFVVEVSVPVSVSVPVPPVSVPVLVVGALHDGVRSRWQSDCPMPVLAVDVVDAVVPGPDAAARAASPGAGCSGPPATSTLTGTAATTRRGIQERARARIRAGRTCGCTALPQGRPGPPTPPLSGQRAYVRIPAPLCVREPRRCVKVAGCGGPVRRERVTGWGRADSDAGARPDGVGLSGPPQRGRPSRRT